MAAGQHWEKEIDMTNERELITFLMADDDPDDRMFAKQALRQYRIRNGMRFVRDGEELMDYLLHQHHGGVRTAV